MRTNDWMRGAVLALGCALLPAAGLAAMAGAGAADSRPGAHARDTAVRPSSGTVAIHRGTRSDGASPGPSALVPVDSYPTIAAALAAAQPGDEIVLGANTYLESNLIINKSDLLIRGAATAQTPNDLNPANPDRWTRLPVSIIDGGNATAPVFRLAPGVKNITLADMGLRNVRHSCVHGEGAGSLAQTHSGFSALRLKLEGCRADLGGVNGGGIYLNGPIDNVAFVDNEVSTSAARALVVWNGFKTNIEFSGNYVHDIVGCCGLDLQDGSASGVRIVDNRIERVGDSGIALTGLTDGGGGAFGGASRIADNLVLNTGRFGIEIKLPDGSGLDAGDGSIVVENNRVYLSGNGDPDFDGDVEEHGLVPGIAAALPSELRDLAGIAVMRRGLADAANVELPAGVVVRGNTIGGYQQNNAGSDSTGFGIVLGGIKHTAAGNTLVQNDVGIQRQAGHTPYCSTTADPPPQADGCLSDQSNLPDAFFGRDNSPLTCAAIGSNTFGSNIEAASRDISGGAGLIVANSVFNEDTGLGYCTLQLAIDDPLTLDGHTLRLSDDVVYAEQVRITKSLRLTRNNAGSAPPLLRAPATVTDLALVRVMAPDVEIDNLRFEVDLAKVGEAIRTVAAGGANPDRVSIHHNTITATASSAAFVTYNRRNALALNLSPNYAPPGEQRVTLTVDVRDNVIGGTQDWNAASVGNQPAYFRAAIGIDQGQGTIAGNSLRGRDYDVFARFTNGAAGLDIGLAGQGNTFAGGGLYVGDGIQPVRVTSNSFAPDRSLLPLADFPMPVGAVRWGDLGTHALRLVNASASVTLSDNTFADHSNSLFAQNFVDLALSGNVFNAPTHGTAFRHVILSTKVLSSGSATVAQVPLALASSGNTFHGSAAHEAIAVELLNHDADAAAYGPIGFADAFDGDFDRLFALDPTSCATSSTCAPAPYLGVYQYGIYPDTVIAPFGGTVDATGSTFDGIAPAAMDGAQYQAVQARTYHNDPDAPEAPAAPATLGRVQFGFAAGIVSTTTTVADTSPDPSAIGAPVTVSVAVTNALGGVPSGSIDVVAADSAGCTIGDYPTSTSCVIAGGFSAGGLRTVTATFTPAVGSVNQGSAGAAAHTVTFATGTTVAVAPAAAPTPTDNDYTRIDNALRAAGSGVVIELAGGFDWTEPNARASWALGSDGVAGTDDDWSSKLRAGVAGVTVRAATPGGASIQGDEGDAPGDFAAFLYSGAANPGWTFENLTVRGFDVAFALFGSGSEGLNGTRFLNNRIEIGPDSGDDYANYGIYTGFGESQTLAGNEILIDIGGADGDPAGANARVVGIQIGDSCNTNCFDGLLVSDNTLTVTGVPGATPARVIGLWENAADTNSAIRIEDNVFIGSGDLGDGVEQNNQTGIIASTQSNGARQSVVRGNTVQGAAFGLRSQWPAYGYYVGSNDPLLLEGNTFTDNGTALRLHAGYPKAARYTLRANRIAGNVVGLFAERADDLPAPGAPGWGGNELPSVIDADDNWWGCNSGPAHADCDTLVVESDGVASGDPAEVTRATWLQLRATATPDVIVPPAASSIAIALVGSADGTTVATAFPDGTSVGLVTSKGAFSPAAPFMTAAGMVSTSLQGLSSGMAVMTATLDNASVPLSVRVNGPVTVNDDVALDLHADPRATCDAPDFSSIQAAVDAVPAHTEILVCAGTYVEGNPAAGTNLQVGKPVVLLGAQAGIDARGRSDAEASIIVPASGNPGLSYGSFAKAVLDLWGGDITLDGFVIDGDNPAIATGVPMGAADPDVETGIWSTGDRMVLVNNVIRNLVYAGVEGYNTTTTQPGRQGNRIQRNWIHNLDTPSSWGIGVVLLWNYYADVSDNRMDAVRLGVQTNYFFKPAPVPAEARIADNAIEASRLGVYHNYHTSQGAQQASPFTIAGNVITANPAVTAGSSPADAAPWGGVFIQTLSAATTGTFSGNQIDGSALAGGGRTRVGYIVGSITTTQAATLAIDGGSVAGVEYGVLANDSSLFPGRVDDMQVRNVAFSDVSIAALAVEDSALAGPETVDNAVRLTVGAGNTFAADVAHHGSLAGPNARLEFAAGVAGLDRMLVRAQGFGYRGTLPDTNGRVRMVNPGVVNAAIADASAGGVVTLEAGTFEQAVALNKSLSLLGPFAGQPGHDPARDGSGEAVLRAPSGNTLTITAPLSTVDGVTLEGAAGGGHAATLSGANADDVVLANSRIVNVPDGSGFSSEPGARCTADGLSIRDNLFQSIGGGGAANGRGIRLGNGHCNVQVSGNVFDTQLHAINANGGSGSIEDLHIADNVARNTTGTAFEITGTTRTQVLRNTVTAAAGGLFISDRTVDFVATCNSLSATGNAFSNGSFFGGAPNTGFQLFHNALSGGALDINNTLAAGLVVGSNWYDGGAAVLADSQGSLRVADPLPGNPVGSPLCGDNSAAALVYYPASGTPQSAEVNQPFAQPLRVRVQDALGGAVTGESVTLSAPAAGASALLAPAAANGSLPVLQTDANGVVEVSAIANGFAGQYQVSAEHATGVLDFALENTALQQVVFDLNGPIAGVEVGQEVAYSGLLANDNPDVNENILIRVTLSSTTALDASDVAFCVVNPMDPGVCIPLAWTDAGATLTLDFTSASGFPITAPYQYLHNFRAVFGKAGVFTTVAQVVGASSGTVYASDQLSTEVVAQHAGVSLELNGPVAGVEKDVATAYSATLSNSAAAVSDAVVVEFVLTRAGGIAAGDVTVEYDAGGGVFLPIPLNDATPGQLTGVFGPAAGFPLTAGYDATTALRVTYHVAPDSFTVAATVVDAGADSDGVASYAADNLSTDVIEADPDVSLTLSGLFSGSDGVTPAAARVGETVVMRAAVVNAGGPVADPVRARLVLSPDFSGVTAGDVQATWGFVPAGGSCAGANYVGSLTFTVDGDTLTDSTNAYPLPEAAEAAVCFKLTFQRAGVYAIGGVIEDAAADTDGTSSYAGDTLVASVGRGDASIALSGLGPIVYDGTPHAAVATVTATASGDALPGLLVDITYNGSATAPTDAGSYSVVATLVDDDWQGSASGTLVITPATATVAFDDLVQTYDGTARLATATIDPVGVAGLSLAYAPTSPPVAVGSYTVTATLSNPNYVLSGPVTASLQVVAADAGISVANASATYDGVPHGVAVANPNGVAYALVYTGTDAGGASYGPTPQAPIRAGQYTATVTVTDANHVGGPYSAAVEIAQAPVSVALSGLGHVYDGGAKPATATTVPAGVALALEYTGTEADGDAYGPSATPPTQAGSYDVAVTVTDSNFALDAVAPSPATLAIAKATAVVQFSALNFVADGQPQPAQYAVSPAGAGIVCSETYTPPGDATVPVAAGSYAVSVACDGPNHTGAASATVTIASAPVASLEIVGAAAFDGIAGAVLPAPGPTVRVLDSTGAPVAGASVEFSVTAGDGAVLGGVVATGADGRAAVGGWRLDPDASAANGLSATVVGRSDIPAVTFTATGSERADLSVLTTSTTTQARAGDVVDFLITVRNAGPSDATAAQLLVALPDELDASSATWLCIPGGAAQCGVVFGSMDIELDVSIPVGDSVTVLLTATIAGEAGAPGIDNTAVVELLSGTDPNALNDQSTHSIVLLPPLEPGIFSDGFEGEPVLPVAQGTVGTLRLTPAWSALADGGAPATLLTVPAASGQPALVVTGVQIDGRVWVRLAAPGATTVQRSGWMAVPVGGDLMLGWSSGPEGLDVGLAAGLKMLTLRVATSAPRVVQPAASVRID